MNKMNIKKPWLGQILFSWVALLVAIFYGPELVAAPAMAPGQNPNGSQVVFVDAGIAGYQTLVRALPPEVETVLIQPGDGVPQMVTALHGKKGVRAVHLLSHGLPGALVLGGQRADLADLERRQDLWRQISQALAPGADLLLYGCDLAADAQGQALVSRLAQITGMHVAASTNPTGAVALGGDWFLEFQVGGVKTAALSGLDDYGDLLANSPPVNTVPSSILVLQNVNSPLTGISVFDPDVGSATPIQVDLFVAAGTLSATSGNVTVSGSGTAHLSLRGSQGNINALLASGQVFYNGTTTTLTMTTSDLGCCGGGVMTDTDIVDLVLAAPGSPTLSVNDVTLVEGNAGTTNAVFTVTLNAPSEQLVTVNYATADGTATSGSDYTPTSGQLAFNAGETSKTVAVAVIGDTIEESDETFFLNLSNPTNATLSDAQGQGTIVNDDSPVQIPTLSVDDVTLVEGNAGTTNAVFTVTLSAPSQQPVTVNYATADGTGTSGSDYTPTSGQLAFNAGETSKTVAVAVLGDTIVESDETFFLNLSNPTNATLSDAQGQGTIVNDDSPVPIPTLGGWATGLLMILMVGLALVRLGRARIYLS